MTLDPPADPPLGDLDDRIPCADDLCTGILGPDGLCGTCGSSSRAREAPSAAHSAVDAASTVDASVDPDDRIPCSDELCTGILGPEARCGTCGRAAGSDVSVAV